MNLKQAAWIKRPELPENDYPLATVLPHATKSRRRTNYTTIFFVATLILWALAMIF